MKELTFSSFKAQIQLKTVFSYFFAMKELTSPNFRAQIPNLVVKIMDFLEENFSTVIVTKAI